MMYVAKFRPEIIFAAKHYPMLPETILVVGLIF